MKRDKKKTGRKIIISDYLSEGKYNAKTSKVLRNILGLNRRSLVAAIERERRDGWPICASTGLNPGYYLADSADEMYSYIASLERRVREIEKTIRACKETAENLP